MLYLVGLGLWDEKDITVRGLEIAQAVDTVLLEEYTSVLKGSSREKIEALVGKEVRLLSRKDLEQETGWMAEAKEKDVVLLVGGDPLVATTHSDLLMRAWDQGIETRVVHNASIFSAVAECGLQIYKFGKTATVTFWEENFRPTSFYDTVRENTEKGLHTLLLMDIKGERQMTPQQAIEILTEIDPGFARREVVAMSRVGGETGIVFGPAAEVAKAEHGTGLHVLLVPGELHVMEKAFLSHFRKH